MDVDIDVCIDGFSSFWWCCCAKLCYFVVVERLVVLVLVFVFVLLVNYLPFDGSGNPSRAHEICGVGFPAAEHFKLTAGPGCSVCSMKLYNRTGGASIKHNTNIHTYTHINIHICIYIYIPSSRMNELYTYAHNYNQNNSIYRIQ